MPERLVVARQAGRPQSTARTYLADGYWVHGEGPDLTVPPSLLTGRDDVLELICCSA